MTTALKNSTFLNKLKQFGLNSYQAKLWMALLSRGVATAGELSDISNVPRSRAYDVLETLEKKGFIMMKVGKPIQYIAVPPEEVLNRVKGRIKEESDREARQIEKLMESEVIHDLTALHENGISKVEPNSLVAAIKGRKNINYTISRLIGEAKEEVFITTTSEGFARKVDTLRRHSKELRGKNVKIKIACPMSPTIQRLARDIRDFAEVRESQIRARFVIIDKSKMIFMLEDDEKTAPRYDSAVSLDSDYFTSNMVKLFEFQWESLQKIN